MAYEKQQYFSGTKYNNIIKITNNNNNNNNNNNDDNCNNNNFFFLSGFSFTNIHDSRDSRGRGRVSV